MNINQILNQEIQQLRNIIGDDSEEVEGLNSAFLGEGDDAFLEEQLANFGGNDLISASLTEADRKMLNLDEDDDLDFFTSNDSRQPKESLKEFESVHYEYSTQEIQRDLGMQSNDEAQVGLEPFQIGGGTEDSPNLIYASHSESLEDLSSEIQSKSKPQDAILIVKSKNNYIMDYGRAKSDQEEDFAPHGSSLSLGAQIKEGQKSDQPEILIQQEYSRRGTADFGNSLATIQSQDSNTSSGMYHLQGHQSFGQESPMKQFSNAHQSSMQADSIREVPEQEELFQPQDEGDTNSIYWEEARGYIEELYQQAMAYRRQKEEEQLESEKEEEQKKREEPVTFNYESLLQEAQFVNSRPESPSLKLENMEGREEFWSSGEMILGNKDILDIKRAGLGNQELFQVEKLKELDELQKEKRGLLNQIVTLKEEHFVQEKRIREQNKEISKLNITVNDLQRKNKELTYRLEDSRRLYNESQEEIDQLQGQIENMYERERELQLEKREAREECESAQGSLKKESELLLSLIEFLERSEGQSQNYRTPLRTIEERVNAIIGKFEEESRDMAMAYSVPQPNHPSHIFIAEAVNPKIFKKKTGYPTDLQSLRNFDHTKLQTSSSYTREKDKKLSKHGQFWRNTSRSPGTKNSSIASKKLNKTFTHDTLNDHGTSPDIGGTLLTDRSDYETPLSSRGAIKERKMLKTSRTMVAKSLKESQKSTPSKKSLGKESRVEEERAKTPRFKKAKVLEQNLKECLKSMIIKKPKREPVKISKRSKLADFLS